MFIMGPFTTSLCTRFGCRKVALLGGILCVVGMVFSAHAPTLHIMFVTFGLTWGLGTSFCYFPTLIILVPYFNKHLALVNGIVSAGAGVGTLVLSPSIQWVARNYGAEKMFYGLGALHCMVLGAAMMYRPLEEKYQERQGTIIKRQVEEPVKDTLSESATKETLLSNGGSKTYLNPRRLPNENEDLHSLDDDCMYAEQGFKQMMLAIKLQLIELFTDKAFVAWCCGLSIFMLGYFVPFVHLVSIPENCKNKKYE